MFVFELYLSMTLETVVVTSLVTAPVRDWTLCRMDVPGPDLMGLVGAEMVDAG